MWKAIDVLESQEQLIDIRTIQTAKSTKKDLIKRERELIAAAYPKEIYKKPSKSKTMSDLQGILGG